ncbi:MAG: tetratricopeptide repeat protein [Bacteroidales bacterium]|nr:tetratricopeptide repeat protein [Bacteroidales bacterium]
MAVIALLTAMVIFPGGRAGARSIRNSQKESWEAGADKRKSDYIFMEAQRQNSLGNDGEYFELLQRAVELDSTDTQPGMTLGYYYMALGQGDTALAMKGYDLMRRHFNSNPSDYYGAIFYGMVNNQLGNRGESVRVWHTLDSLNPHKPNVTMKYAEALQGVRDSASLRRSIDVLNRLERAEGVDIGLTSNKVRALMILRDTTATLAEVSNLLTATGNNPNSSLYAGDVMMAIGRPDSAIALYNRACEIDPTNGLAYYKRAEFYREQGDSIGFDREVFEAVRQEGLDPEVKIEIFSSYIRQLYADTLQQPRIQGLFDTLLIQHPHEAQIRDLYSSYLVAIKDFKGAAEQQEYALDTDPSNTDRWRSAVSLYATAEDYDKALETAGRALKYTPDDPALMFYRANMLAMLDRSDEALSSYSETLDATPVENHELRSAVLCSMGDTYYKTGAIDSAFVYYDRALEENPDNLLALNNCAYFMAEEGIDLDKAEKMSAICVRQQPDNDTALDTYAWIFFKKKEYNNAKDFIDRAIELEGDDPQADVLHHAGDIYYMNGDHQKALLFWEEALKLDPDNLLLQKKVKNKTHFYE